MSLQELAAKLRTEVVDLDGQLDTERSYRSKAEQENSELKELWENEVKAKHKITEKVNKIKVIQHNILIIIIHVRGIIAR